MPFVESTDIDPRAGFGRTPSIERPDSSDVFGAAFRQGNIVVSALANQRRGYFPPEDGYSALDDIQNTPYFDNHASRFFPSRSHAETVATMRQIDREQADKNTLASSGAIGVLASAAAGTLDPTMLLPGRIAVGAIRGGASFARGAAEVGGAMAVQSTAQEMGLHATQETRTLPESVMNVGSSTILGALIGGGASALLSRGERQAMTAALDRDRAAMDAHVYGQPIGPEHPLTYPHSLGPEMPPDFPKWFGNSKVVDEAGNPTITYHGTLSDFENFDISHAGKETDAPSAKKGIFFTSNPDLASSYAEGFNAYTETRIGRFLQWATGGRYEKFNEAVIGLFGKSAIQGGGNVRPAFLKIENPLIHDFQGQEYREISFSDLIDKAKKEGHDGLIIKNTIDPGWGNDPRAEKSSDVYVVFSPDQIKSSIGHRPPSPLPLERLPVQPTVERSGPTEIHPEVLRAMREQAGLSPPRPTPPEAAPLSDLERMQRALGGTTTNYEGSAVGTPLAETARPPEVIADALQERAKANAPAVPSLPPRTPFPENFPTLVFQQPPNSKLRLKELPGFEDARKGDFRAAAQIVQTAVSDAKVAEIKAQIGDRNPVLVAVKAEDTEGGRNVLPLAYAEELSHRLGLEVDGDIMQAHRVKHRDAGAATRIANRTGFHGRVEPGRDYYLVDDMAVQGGTMADLRSHIEANGGNVIGGTALMGSISSHILGPRPETLAKLRAKYPDLEAWWHEQFGHNFDVLTDSEAQYLANATFKSDDSLRSRILEAVHANDLGAAARASGKEQISRIRELIAEGKSFSEVGAELGISRNTVAGVVNRAGIEVPPKRIPRGFWQGEGLEQLMRLNDEGATVDKIAEHFGISENHVWTLMSNNGIALKNPRAPGVKPGTAAKSELPATPEWETLPDGTMVRRYGVGAEAAGASTLPPRAGTVTADTATLQPVRTGVGLERVAWDPVMQALNQPSVEGRRAVADLVEVPTLVNENLRGQPTTTLGAAPLETMARLINNQLQVKVRDELMRLWGDMRFEGGKVPLKNKAMLWAGLPERTGSEAAPTFEQFKIMVSDAMMEGDQHAVPQVQEAAKFIRDNVFEPWAARAEKVFPEFGRQEAEAYFPHVWNKTKIENNRPEFVNKLVAKLWCDQTTNRGIQDRLRSFQGALQSRQATIDKLSDAIDKRTAKMNEAQTELDAATKAHKEAFQRATELRQSEFKNEGGIAVPVPGKNREKATELARQETAIREQVNKLADKVSGFKHEIEDLDHRLQNEHLHANAVRGRIEEEIGRWEGKSTNEAKSALKAREKYEAERQAKAAAAGKEKPTERLRAADDTVDLAVKRILKTDQNRGIDEIRAQSNEIVDRVLGSPDGRLAYDEYHPGGDTAPRGPGQSRGSLARRTLDVDNEFARGWVNDDVERVVRDHLRTFVPDVLLAERFGDVEMSGQIKAIEAEYGRLIDAAGPSEADRVKLNNQRNSTVETVAALRDRFRGLYRIPADAAARRLGRISTAVRNANVPLSLGMATVSSLADAAGAVFRWGMTAAFRDGWTPFVKSLMTDRELTGEATRQFRAMGIAVDTFTATRHREFSGLVESYRPGSPLEQGLQWGADKFNVLNMLGPWTDVVKTISSTIASVELYHAAKASAAGTIGPKQLRALGENNIESRLAGRIAEQYEKHGNTIDGVMLPNTEEWTDKAAKDAFEAALSREANIAVVTPGLDKPLLFSDPVLATLLQFKSFTAAATTRIMVANLQRMDAETLQGLVASLAMGMLSYKVSAIAGGQPTSDRPQDWIKEAMSRGNIFGWLEEGNALASKMTRGGVDIYRLIGANKPLSKFASQSAAESLMGPTLGKMQNIVKATSAASARDWSESDTKALRRLIPGQNLFYLRRLFDQVESGANNAFGIHPAQPHSATVH